MKTTYKVLLGLLYLPIWLAGAVLVALTWALIVALKFPRALGLYLTNETKMAKHTITKFLFKV